MGTGQSDGMSTAGRVPDSPQAGSEDPEVTYGRLKQIAHALLSHERKGHTLQGTALLHEAYLRLGRTSAASWSTQEVFPLAIRAMRHVLVDHARARLTRKRKGNSLHSDLDEHVLALEQGGVSLLEIEEALTQLGRIDDELRKIVEWRFFGGLSNQEVASMLGIPLRSVERGWHSARALLKSLLSS